jgi:hypothetical protein
MSEASLAVLARTRARQSEVAEFRLLRESEWPPRFICRLRTPKIVHVRNASLPSLVIDEEIDITRVYLWRAGEMLKIGQADNVAARLSRLSTGCPVAETEAVMFGGPIGLEHVIQDRFAALHSHGEWFHFRGMLRALYFELKSLGEVLERPRSRRGDNKRIRPPA